MRDFTVVIEKCPGAALYVGYVPGFPGAHSQGENLDELDQNLREVIEMLIEEGPPQFESEFVGIRRLTLTPADVDPELGVAARGYSGLRSVRGGGFSMARCGGWNRRRIP